jgi:excinuclease ABC subunit C
MPPDIVTILKNLPQLPGVYRYYGAEDNVLYVGKAKNLKNRVSQYFQNNKLDGNQRLQTMVSQIERIEYTIVKTEKESLILEANLIYSLQPKYNVLLKDDRSYLYVRISGNDLNSNKKESYIDKDNGSITNIANFDLTNVEAKVSLESLPKITLTRRKYDKSSNYYGPYTKKFGIVNVLRVLRTIFPYCENAGSKFDFKHLGKPCHYVQLRQCDGVCCGKETPEQYLSKIKQIQKILSGETDEVKEWIKTKIAEAIAIDNYQLAGLWRDRINMLDEVIDNQQIILPQPQNLDIITLIHETDISGLAIASVFIQNIREGKIINLNNFIMSGTKDIEDEIENKAKTNNFETLSDSGDLSLLNSEINFLKENSPQSPVDNTQELGLQNSQSNSFQIQNFIQTFLVNYYSEQAYKPEILLQVFENSL